MTVTSAYFKNSFIDLIYIEVGGKPVVCGQACFYSVRNEAKIPDELTEPEVNRRQVWRSPGP